MLWETADRQNCGHQKITCIEQKACLNSINIDGITKAFRDVFETGLKIHTNREYQHSKMATITMRALCWDWWSNYWISINQLITSLFSKGNREMRSSSMEIWYHYFFFYSRGKDKKLSSLSAVNADWRSAFSLTHVNHLTPKSNLLFLLTKSSPNQALRVTRRKEMITNWRGSWLFN